MRFDIFKSLNYRACKLGKQIILDKYILLTMAKVVQK
jgi:hypothetical protein